MFRWLDLDAGLVVRPYAVVRGRTKPAGERFDVLAIASPVPGASADTSDLEPEHLAVLRACRPPASVAEIASGLDLPLGVVRVLLADLRALRLVAISQPAAQALSDLRLLTEVADGLRRM